jgi:methionyl-tRNA formyltransferase
MRILLLGPLDSALANLLAEFGEQVVIDQEALDVARARTFEAEVLISYGYRHIIRPEVLRCFQPGRAVNLHISYLPHNRGADPNFWSHVLASKTGVSIHALDDRVDTGDIYAQRVVEFDLSRDTLRTSYGKLQAEMITLFRSLWPALRAGQLTASPQQGRASVHKKRHQDALSHLLTDGFDTKLDQLTRHAAEMQICRAFFL